MTLCCHPNRHDGATRSGRRPSCPKGDRKIPAAVATFMTKRYSNSKRSAAISFSDSDYMCRRCLEYETGCYENHKSENISGSGVSRNVDRSLSSLRSQSKRLKKEQDYVESDSSTAKSHTISVSTTDSDHAQFASRMEKKRLEESLNTVLSASSISPIKDL